MEQISRYRNRISGPLLDRIDMHVEVPRQPIPIDGTQSSSQEEGSDQIQARTIADIEACPEILTSHLSEAIGYRRLDRRQQY